MDLVDQVQRGAGLAEVPGNAAMHAENGPVYGGRQRQRVKVAVDCFPHCDAVALAERSHALSQKASILVLSLRTKG
jgi:hypothetical protein